MVGAEGKPEEWRGDEEQALTRIRTVILWLSATSAGKAGSSQPGKRVVPAAVSLRSDSVFNSASASASKCSTRSR